jgi:hypothetical protein
MKRQQNLTQKVQLVETGGMGPCEFGPRAGHRDGAFFERSRHGKESDP